MQTNRRSQSHQTWWLHLSMSLLFYVVKGKQGKGGQFYFIFNLVFLYRDLEFLTSHFWYWGNKEDVFRSVNFLMFSFDFQWTLILCNYSLVFILLYQAVYVELILKLWFHINSFFEGKFIARSFLDSHLWVWDKWTFCWLFASASF